MKEKIRAKRDSKVSSPRLGEKGEGGRQGPWEEETAREGWPGMSRSGYVHETVRTCARLCVCVCVCIHVSLVAAKPSIGAFTWKSPPALAEGSFCL